MEVRALTAAEAATIGSWRYPGRYSTYDFDAPPPLAGDTWAVTEAEELIGYCCSAPRRVGAILEFALERYDPERLRLYILEWNERSRKVAAGHGFAVESVLASDEGAFLVMTRAAAVD